MRVLQHRQGLSICCVEEIALNQGFITPEGLEPWLMRLGKSNYADYIRRVIAKLAE